MIRQTMIFSVCLAICGLAQDAEPQGDTPPDQKAYNSARDITDPGAKIDALEKFKKDFPDSMMVNNANVAILSTLVRKMPKETERIRKFAAAMYTSAEDREKASVGTSIANQFLGAGLLLKDARSYARKALGRLKFSSYMKEQLAAAEKRKAKVPDAAALTRRFQENRASRLALLGQIEVALGHTDKGRKILEDAWPSLIANGAAASVLGELAAKRGDTAKAMEYLTTAQLSGNASKPAVEAFEAIYRKQHQGSLDGVERFLDAEYAKRFPAPLTVETYTPSAKRSDRVVLAEVFTGAGCGPCVAADLAFDVALGRYSRKDVAVLMYHQHIPRPDPMTNPDTTGRGKSYSIPGTPEFVLDGKREGGGGGRERTGELWDRIRPGIEKGLETPAEAQIATEVKLSGGTVTVHGTVQGVKAEAKDVRVYAALVEKELRYTGENGIRFHPMVVRAMAGKDGSGFPVGGGETRFDQMWDLAEISKGLKAYLDDYEAKGHRGETFSFKEKKFEIDRHELAVVVFVQNAKTKHVLQAGFFDLAGEARSATTKAGGLK